MAKEKLGQGADEIDNLIAAYLKTLPAKQVRQIKARLFDLGGYAVVKDGVVVRIETSGAQPNVQLYADSELVPIEGHRGKSNRKNSIPTDRVAPEVQHSGGSIRNKGSSSDVERRNRYKEFSKKRQAEIGDDFPVILDANVFVDAVVQLYDTKCLQILKLVEKGRLVLCTTPDINREVNKVFRGKVEKVTENIRILMERDEERNWVLGLLSQAMNIESQDFWSSLRPPESMDPHDIKYLFALDRLQQIDARGLLVSWDHDLLDLVDMYPGILNPKAFMLQVVPTIVPSGFNYLD